MKAQMKVIFVSKLTSRSFLASLQIQISFRSDLVSQVAIFMIFTLVHLELPQ